MQEDRRPEPPIELIARSIISPLAAINIGFQITHCQGGGAGSGRVVWWADKSIQYCEAIEGLRQEWPLHKAVVAGVGARSLK